MAKAKNQKPSILRKDFVFSETDFFQSENFFTTTVKLPAKWQQMPQM